MKRIRPYLVSFIALLLAAACLSGCQVIDLSVLKPDTEVTTLAPADTTPPETTPAEVYPTDSVTDPSDTATGLPAETTEAPAETTVETTPPPTEATEPPELDPETPHEHIEKAVISKAPSWNGEGERLLICEKCHEELAEPRALPALKAMNSRYGYESLSGLANGDGMQAFYREFEALATAFHNSSAIDAKCETVMLDGEKAYVYTLPETVKYSKYGLTLDQAKIVWSCLRSDNPLFYWISQTVLWEDTNKEMYLVCDEKFADGTLRYKANLAIYERMLELLSDETSPYMLAFSYHDTVISGMEYKYESDGKTPANADIYHGVAGFVLEGSGVCETYAKTFQLLLNYSGVENMVVNGIADGTGHAWNLAKMDDGEWYWFDLTWDDPIDEWKWGVEYRCFCVNDTENIYWREGGYTYSQGNKSFTQTHTPFDPSVVANGYMWSLPERATGTFESEDIPHMKSEFTEGGVTYTVVGYRKVEASAVEGAISVKIGGKVSHGGVSYEVVAVGKRTEIQNHYITYKTPIIQGEASSVELGEGITHIWNNAFNDTGELKTVILPASLEFIYSGAFANCRSLETIYYEGTYEMWQRIDKKSQWNAYSGDFKLVCTDGEYTVSQ